jgi:hypothetical protein
MCKPNCISSMSAGSIALASGAIDRAIPIDDATITTISRWERIAQILEPNTGGDAPRSDIEAGIEAGIESEIAS